MYKGKITVVGTGFVGSTTAYTLMVSGIASEIVLVDMNMKKAEGDAMDMSHGVVFVSPCQIVAGGYEAAKDSDLVVITAGVGQKPGETRTELLRRNVAVFKDILSKLLPYCKEDTILLIVTNPVDILTYVTWKLSGFPKNRVIGSGTVLDTARLKYLIGEHTGVDVRNVHTYVIGEHGDTEVAAWSMTSIAGMKLEEYCGVCKGCEDGSMCKEDFHHRTKNAAYEIIERKGSTYYAVALAVRRIVECIIGDERSILTVSTPLEGEYGIDGISLGLPSIVGRDGIVKLLEVPLSDDERDALHHSANTLKDLLCDIEL